MFSPLEFTAGARKTQPILGLNDLTRLQTLQKIFFFTLMMLFHYKQYFSDFKMRIFLPHVFLLEKF